MTIKVILLGSLSFKTDIYLLQHMQAIWFTNQCQWVRWTKCFHT